MSAATATTKSSKSAPLLLSYWLVQGRGAQLRLALSVAGAAFENKLLATPADLEADAKRAGAHPFFNTPSLTTAAGQVITQSGAVLRHIGREHDLYGATAAERARVDEVIETIVDYRTELHKFTYAPSAERAAELRPSFFAETVPYFLGGLDKFVAANGTAFVAGAGVTIADCAVLPELDMFAQLVERPAEEALAAYPALLKVYRALLEVPAVQRYRADANMGQLKPNGPGASWGAVC